MNEENIEEPVKIKSKRGRKPKPKSDIPKIPKKRGRKPKPKPDIQDLVPKIPKKRGRRKKCDIDALSKISGFSATGDSIDTKDNKMTFTGHIMEEDTTDNEGNEKISFGKFNIGIQSTVSPETVSIKTKYHTRNNSLDEDERNLCNIDLPDYESSDSEDSTVNDSIVEPLINVTSVTKKSPKKSTEIVKAKHRKSKFKLNPDRDLAFVLEQFKGKDDNKTTYPEKTDIHCWWCAHTFDGPPKPLPCAYDELRNRFKVTGVFCSWSCAKAYALNDNSLCSKFCISHLNQLVQQIHGTFINFPHAPPRQALKMFGGKLTIKEFRGIDKNDYYIINKANMILDYNIYVERTRKRR
jgi:hypothetical protein